MLALHTERLSLRTLVEADWPLFLQLHRDPTTMQYVFGDIDEAYIRKGFEHRLPAWTPESAHWLSLVISERATGQALGVAGWRLLRPGHAELGILLLPHSHGQGYGTDCCLALIDQARAFGLTSLESTVTDGNTASCRVLEKLGFTFERREPQAYQIGEQWFDDLIYHYNL
jgi:RimJ/RimL family protein N-acetyltransferase